MPIIQSIDLGFTKLPISDIKKSWKTPFCIVARLSLDALLAYIILSEHIMWVIFDSSVLKVLQS